jgi:hypothetical protein
MDRSPFFSPRCRVSSRDTIWSSMEDGQRGSHGSLYLTGDAFTRSSSSHPRQCAVGHASRHR